MSPGTFKNRPIWSHCIIYKPICRTQIYDFQQQHQFETRFSSYTEKGKKSSCFHFCIKFSVQNWNFYISTGDEKIKVVFSSFWRQKLFAKRLFIILNDDDGRECELNSKKGKTKSLKTNFKTQKSEKYESRL